MLQVMQKIGWLEDHFSNLKSWMVKEVLPGHLNLVGRMDQSDAEESVSISTNQNIDAIRSILLKLVQKVIENPNKVCLFMVRNFNIPTYNVFWYKYNFNLPQIFFA